MPSKFFDKIIKRTSKESKIYVSKSLDIIDQIYEITERKGMTQKDLANALWKNESEISKWLSGEHNLTLRTIAKIEAVLGEDIIITPMKAKKQYKKKIEVKKKQEITV